MPFYVPAVFPRVFTRTTWSITAVGTQSRSQGHLGFQNGGIFESREVPGIKVLLHVKDKLSENFLKIFLILLGYAPYFWRFKDLS